MREWARIGVAVTLLASVRWGSGQTAIGFENVTFLDGGEVSQCQLTAEHSLLPAAVVVEPTALVLFVAGLMVYMFWALFYVVERVLLPSIHVGIGRDVSLPDSMAGASLLALGGCTVPMFFINLFSLTQEPATATGVATVIGSSAFNFLFVLPACLLASDLETTPLYWWPLIRDLTFYILGLCLCSLFLRFWTQDWEATQEVRNQECWGGQESICCYQHYEESQDEFQPVDSGVMIYWEGLILMILYLFHLIVLRWNHRIRRKVERFANWVGVWCCCAPSQQDKAFARRAQHQREQEEHLQKESDRQKKLKKSTSSRRNRSKSSSAEDGDAKRASIMQMLNALNIDPMIHRACTIIVLQTQGDAKATFEQLFDQRKHGSIDVSEIRDFVHKYRVGILGKEFLANEPEVDIDERLGDCVKGLTKAFNNNSSSRSVDLKRFEEWYTKMEATLVKELNAAFSLLDEANLGEVSVPKLAAILELLGARPSHHCVHKTREKLEISKKGRIGRKEFEEWYRTAMLWSVKENIKENNNVQHATVTDEPKEMPSPTSGGGLDLWGRHDGSIPTIDLWAPDDDTLVVYVAHFLGLPVRAAVILTTFNFLVGQAHELSFIWSLWWLIVAITWIFLFSWMLLFSAETIGLTLEIPNTAMGSTIIALGLNMPHFLSAVRRAKVSEEERFYQIVRTLEHSIKGNVFDLLMGLPFSWVIANLTKGRPIYIGASNIDTSFAMLTLIVFLTLILWATARWELDVIVAIAMILLYIIFLLQDLILSDWSKPIPSYILCEGCRSDMVCANI